jgi:hypothetical protein
VKRAGFRIAARRIFSTLGQTRRHIAQHEFAFSHMSAAQAAAEHPATFKILGACLFRDCTRRWSRREAVRVAEMNCSAGGLIYCALSFSCSSMLRFSMEGGGGWDATGAGAACL